MHDFTKAFSGLGCAGEIKISEHEDYKKWAIDILVKFRDHEKLQLLTAERQSGGVCSLEEYLSFACIDVILRNVPLRQSCTS